ncbi:MAG: aldose 1-epimerase [Armatimonadota bacterium]|nr:aldose 1-epimerase [Armatimonadota bacterium]
MPYRGLERYTPERNFGCRISDRYTYKGWKLLVLENELLRVEVLPEKGSDIWSFLYKPFDIDFMWRTPQGLCDRALYVPTISPPEGNFMDFYEGGWQEIAPSGGEGCTYKNAVYGHHGEVWNLPWECVIERDEPEEVAARLTCRLFKSPLVIEKRLTLREGEPILHIDEKITNYSEESFDFMWGHHPSFGAPFLNANCVIDIRARKIAVHSFPEDQNRRFERGQVFDWPTMITRWGETVDGSRIPPPECKGSDELCFLDLEEGWYAITDTVRKVGFALEWDLSIFPYVWFWQVFGGGAGWPWYGRTYNCALEPWSSYPQFGLTRVIEEGTQKTLAPGQSITTHLKAIAHSGASRVAKVQQGRVIPA